ncbi:MAG: zinc-dependent alcohol dehydrogenase family protein [Gammaproteobacteria bacterium]
MPKTVRFHETGGPEVLKIEEMPVIEPVADEVRLQVEALGLNRAEAAFRSGMYLEAPRLPARIGYEAAGVIDAVGSEVTDLKVGDRVSSIPGFSMNRYGVYAESAVLPARCVARYPGSMPVVEGTAIWMQYLTAWGGLVRIGHLAAGDAVVITAASSSVGLAAIQICNMLGATAIATTRHADKKQSLLGHGAAHVIVTEEEDLVARVMAITDGVGADITFDPITGPFLGLMAGAAKKGGLVIAYGSLHQGITEFPLFAAAGKALTIRAYTLFEFSQDPGLLAPGKKFVMDGLESGALKPVIDRTFPFDQIVAAHEYLESNRQMGKIVVTV